ncbi:hypothetical protein BT96DRAFT_914807 [Gymnopus androsaceus JB14]|uniref:Uncharacterized protein n=1 Tax=Gymnopus androsaceus JB14 TaxID=1447944 RepID=A0A6A4IBQ2_9AGAR|nr:hypothetical protein BT96DRAFT_914807 [Gymnopus androsaceus JB14]
MSMEIDHYYTQRDSFSTPQHIGSAPNTPARGAGKIRIPSLTVRKKSTPLHREIFGSDDEYEVDAQQDDAQRFLDSLALDAHSMNPRPRRIAGTRRVVSAQTAQRMKEQAGWKVGGLTYPDCGYPALPAPQVFQSITALPNMSGGSFEELRVECYAQSYIATGAPPPPSTPLSVDAFGGFQREQHFPPTFRPYIVANPALHLDSTQDVQMMDA